MTLTARLFEGDAVGRKTWAMGTVDGTRTVGRIYRVRPITSGLLARMMWAIT